MSTHLININDTAANWWITEPIYSLGIPPTMVAGRYYDVTYITLPTLPRVIDPKLERQYNMARAKNNKNEMRRLERLIANN